MRFLRPEMAVWLLAVPAGMFAWVIRFRYKRRWGRPSAAVARLSRRSGTPREVAVLLLSVVVLGGLAAAMMRPQLAVEQSQPTYASRDLIVVLDRSVSMRARDVGPSRFDRAIEELQHFLKRKPEAIDRVALVGFASTSIVLSYPTDDLSSLFFYLDWMREDPTPFFGTDLTGALTSALTVVRREPQRVPPVVVLISDGDDQGKPVDQIATTLRRAGIRVHSIGIGSDQSVPMPLPASAGRVEYLRDDAGQVVLTRFNERTLQQLAELTDGRYVRSVSGSQLRDALEGIVQADRPQVGWTRTVTHRELYLLMLAAAAVAGVGLVMWL